jgi:hypothetical protein
MHKSHAASPSSRLRTDMADGAKQGGKSLRRRRSGSNSSGSSLSSVKSVPEHFKPPELHEDESAGLEGEVRSGRRQAGDRHPAATSSRSTRNANNLSSINTTDSASPFATSAVRGISDKLRRTQQAREAADQETADIEKRRKRLLRESEADYNERPPKAILNERHQISQNFDDGLYTTASGDDNYPRPPVVHERPARVLNFERVLLGVPAGQKNLMNGTGRKRAYEEFDDDDDDSSDALTPLSSSPVPPFAPPPPPGAERSRAATPRASTRSSGPIAKVARKSARVLVS